MAAYAALVSLFNTLEQIKNHPRFSTSLDKFQIESLGQNIDFFLDFVESYKSVGEEAEEIEAQIASAAHEAEDVIETHIVDQILPESISDVHLHRRCLFGLQKVILDMNFIKNKILKVKQERDIIDHEKPRSSMSAATSTPLITTGKNSSMVGFDDEMYQLKDVLIGQQSSLQIISIVGMGGMGKTTLARHLYEDSLIMHHFDLLAWAAISQDYNVRDIYLQLLSLTSGKLDELAEQLYKRLFGRRYLIILDDMWSIDVWNDLKKFFPNNDNGSRVVLTTRLSRLANDLGSLCITLNFLDEHHSWNLFCQKVFGQEDCPPELVRIGKNIVEQCKGLSLSIVVVGGLLKKSYKTKEYWRHVAENISSVLNSRENGQCLDALYLSYSHLPAHLKPCFLYLGTFPEDHQISVSKVIKLWVAEGFLKPNGVQILEDIAEEYLKELIERNLLLVYSHRKNGKIRSCGIHDLLRELCLHVAHKEKFFCVLSEFRIPRDITCHRRLIHASSRRNSEVVKALKSASLTRSLICNLKESPVECRLLKILDKVYNPYEEVEIHNVNLRYLDFLVYSIPSSIKMLWNLQTLIFQRFSWAVVAPIWTMRQLRHLKGSCILLPNPSPSYTDDGTFVLHNLQTLEGVMNFRLTDEACKRIPNIKKLRLIYGDMWEGYADCLFDGLPNLVHLHKLESLSIWCTWTSRIWSNVLKNAFPKSLNKLSLGVCGLHWEDVVMIAYSLPQLEVLKLEDTFSEAWEWSCVDEGGFLRLKYLSIKNCNLKSWTLASASYFPVLEKLVLIRLWFLNEIPSDIGHVQALQLIRLEDCSESSVISAMMIKEEQESYGNDGLLVQVRMPTKKAERLKHKVKVEGFSIDNIHLVSYRANYFKEWNVILCVLTWWISIKRIIARKRR